MSSEPLASILTRRRSYYELQNSVPVSDAAIEELVQLAVRETPSAFNSQSARTIILYRAEHQRFWDLVLTALRKIVPANAFSPTEAKINSFRAAYGTVLYFEDWSIIETLQEKLPLYAKEFPVWSSQAAGMLQLAVWAFFREAGVGASLQHYGNLVEKEVRAAWGIPPAWRLIAQMPFGAFTSEPQEVPQVLPLSERVRVFG
ncbi:MAG: nitroreductase family protein [Planctomycetota bacterium]|jgi:predicted oxidoreductase (fatty acid repression mutant protein)|nr:nitroreductase family protein [Planctomycetota bacterium]